MPKILLLGLTLLTLSACGVKGDLYLPQKSAGTNTSSANTPEKIDANLPPTLPESSTITPSNADKNSTVKPAYP
jgi:predicted small lipoprotein YifL